MFRLQLVLGYQATFVTHVDDLCYTLNACIEEDLSVLLLLIFKWQVCFQSTQFDREALRSMVWQVVMQVQSIWLLASCFSSLLQPGVQHSRPHKPLLNLPRACSFGYRCICAMGSKFGSAWVSVRRLSHWASHVCIPFRDSCLRACAAVCTWTLTLILVRPACWENAMQLVAEHLCKLQLCSRYSYLMGGREPQLYYDKEGYAAALLEACQTLKQPYAAPMYLRNRHMHLVSSTGACIDLQAAPCDLAAAFVALEHVS